MAKLTRRLPAHFRPPSETEAEQGRERLLREKRDRERRKRIEELQLRVWVSRTINDPIGLARYEQRLQEMSSDT